MRTMGFTIGVLVFAVATVTAETPSERQASAIRADAQELRDEAETVRQEGDSSRAKQLDAKADAMYDRAEQIDSAGWPPNE